MEFDLSSEQMAMRDAALRFAADQLALGYAMREREGKLDRALVRRMGELGLIAPELPEEVGGLGVDCVTAGLVIEAIAGADLNVSYVQLLGSLMGAILVAHGRPEVAHPVVRGICEGRQLVALGLTEPGAGSDAANLQLKARRTNAGYVLDGDRLRAHGHGRGAGSRRFCFSRADECKRYHDQPVRRFGIGCGGTRCRPFRWRRGSA
jgi:cyclohexanecarboxyl-CoA dehydrogenase